MYTLTSSFTRIGRPFRSVSSSLTMMSSFVPKDVHIPLEKLDYSYSKSSGPGGQNVNKVNTKAEIRFNIKEADWLPEEVKARLEASEIGNVNKLGELVITAQEYRTQKQNRELCIEKLREMVTFAYVEPKDRHMWTV